MFLFTMNHFSVSRLSRDETYEQSTSFLKRNVMFRTKEEPKPERGCLTDAVVSYFHKRIQWNISIGSIFSK